MSGNKRYTVLIIAITLSLAALGGVLIDHYGVASGSGSTLGFSSTPVAAPRPSPSPSLAAPTTPPASAAPADPRLVTALTISYPTSGPDTFRYATTTGPVLGESGPIHRFRVAIESNITAVTVPALVAKIDATLGDARSWIGGGQFRLQQAPSTSSAQFTIYLATPRTTSRMCAPLRVNDYTSCRQGTHVVLNLARYLTSVPSYTKAGTVLDTYRTYMINHEVGHALGHGHELCPGPGRPAPVMQQQTFGLHGCRANPWPYIQGRRYDGPPGTY